MDCPHCGNPTDDELHHCRWCDLRIEGSKSPSPRERLVTLNLKAGQPTVDEARKRLHQKLREIPAANCPVLKVIHGYGSSGVGGKIREGLVKTLGRLVREGKIKAYSMGMDHELPVEKINSLLKHGKGQKDDLSRRVKSDLSNPGVSFLFR